MGRSKFRTRSHEKGGGGHDHVLVHSSPQRTISGPGPSQCKGGGDALRRPGTKAAALNNNARKRLILW